MYQYLINVGLNQVGLEKEVKQAQGKIMKLNDNQILLNLDLNTNPKKFKALFNRLEKEAPEVMVQIQYDLNKRTLDKKLKDMKVLEQLKIDLSDTKKAESSVKKTVQTMTSEIKKGFEEGLSGDALYDSVRGLFQYLKSAKSEGIEIPFDLSTFKEIDEKTDGLVTKISKSSKSLSGGFDSLDDAITSAQKDIDYLNGSIEYLTRQGAFDRIADEVSNLNDRLDETEEKAKKALKVSPSQEFDNEIQKNITYLENYKNTLKEIDKLKLEPETEETKKKLEELNDLAKYFASNITSIRSENGHIVSAEMMQFNGTWAPSLMKMYTSQQLKELYAVAHQNYGLAVDKPATEYSHITEELKNIESQSESTRQALAKDLVDSKKYAQSLADNLHDLVEMREELNRSSLRKSDREEYEKEVARITEKYPEILEIADKLKNWDSALKFTASDEWLDFLATLPQAHKYLESIGYDFSKIKKESDEAEASVGSVVREWQQTGYTEQEHGVGFRAVTDTVLGTQEGITETVIRSAIENAKEQVNGFLHTHPYQMAAFSDNDIEAFFKLFEDGVRYQIAAAQKQAMTIDMGLVNTDKSSEIMSDIKSGYAKIDDEIKSTFVNQNIKQIQEIGNTVISGIEVKNPIMRELVDNIQISYDKIFKEMGDSLSFDDYLNAVVVAIKDAANASKIFNSQPDNVKAFLIEQLKGVTQAITEPVTEMMSEAAQERYQEILLSVFSNPEYLKSGVATAIRVQDLEDFIDFASIKASVQKAADVARDTVENAAETVAVYITPPQQDQIDAVANEMHEVEQATDKADDSIEEFTEDYKELNQETGKGKNIFAKLVDAAKTFAREFASEVVGAFKELKQMASDTKVTDIIDTSDASKQVSSIQEMVTEEEKLADTIEEVGDEAREASDKIDEESAALEKQKAEMLKIAEAAFKMDTNQTGTDPVTKAFLQHQKEIADAAEETKKASDAIGDELSNDFEKATEGQKKYELAIYRGNDALSQMIDLNRLASAAFNADTGNLVDQYAKQKLIEQSEEAAAKQEAIRAAKIAEENAELEKQKAELIKLADIAFKLDTNETRMGQIYKAALQKQKEQAESASESAKTTSTKSAESKSDTSSTQQAEAEAQKKAADAEKQRQALLQNTIRDLRTRAAEYKNEEKYVRAVREEAENLDKTLSNLSSSDLISEKSVADAKKRLRELQKFGNSAAGKIADQTLKNKYLEQISQYTTKYTNLSASTRQALHAIEESIKNAESKADLKKLYGQFVNIKTAAREAGEETQSMFTKISNRLSDMNAKFIAQFFSLQDLIRYVRELANNVVQVDSALTELRKVSDASTERLAQSFEASAKSAQDLGSSITDVINITSDWARLGKSIDVAEDLARVTTLFKTVGDNMTADDASSYLVSTMQGFQLADEKAEEIVDKYNEVANNFAINTQGIGEALQRSAASFNAANTDLSKSIALITATNEVVQNPESVGTLWKTMGARIRGKFVPIYREIYNPCCVK